ncbi:kynureninase [Scleromatobacter humisilvae]|uniref:Kynureninase n=1 Tax=Scleromatobacter humisilvae TaxID=2897159 RepID=A0A9X2C1Z2_9BURK|nr:kynureninase [Scleromatobacter humisilvae]MCK9688111.1 kynureninase [Scleromatobacter humisilvae]
MISRDDCARRDAADALAPLRDQFMLPEGVIYVDGNSLGALPRATPARVADAVRQEWGDGLIRSWNDAGWITLPQRVGDRIGALVGAKPGECVAADSTSVNLFKVLSAASRIVKADSSARRVIVSERQNFPTDLYIAEGLCRDLGWTLELLEPPALIERLSGGRGGDVAIMMLTQVNYRTGALHDMASMTALAHAAGALTVWDLAHSAGALPVDLNGAGADFAIGCGYKFLNGGPGAPAFVWAHPRHAGRFWQPLSGWMGHAAPFTFRPHYEPAAGIARFLCGTPAVLSLTALECGVDTLRAADALGGMAAIRDKSIALTELFVALVDERCAPIGFACASPRDARVRGSQVSLTHASADGASHGYAIMQALIARGVIGDFRAGTAADAHGPALPDILRFGFTPLYLRFVDVFDAVDHLVQVMQREEYREARFNKRSAVT